ncbi:unnamed protein product [Protopolystoma xenopodis]|uniref:Uncharacterized protein n=1 Tax=Protopolystoma xenopodis TaxID=117903 RepID=A0A448XMW4_9PLAT|nr:unnamed protein product [Protopolystoma xenopodis]
MVMTHHPAQIPRPPSSSAQLAGPLERRSPIAGSNNSLSPRLHRRQPALFSGIPEVNTQHSPPESKGSVMGLLSKGDGPETGLSEAVNSVSKKNEYYVEDESYRMVEASVTSISGFSECGGDYAVGQHGLDTGMLLRQGISLRGAAGSPSLLGITTTSSGSSPATVVSSPGYSSRYYANLTQSGPSGGILLRPGQPRLTSGLSGLAPTSNDITNRVTSSTSLISSSTTTSTAPAASSGQLRHQQHLQQALPSTTASVAATVASAPGQSHNSATRALSLAQPSLTSQPADSLFSKGDTLAFTMNIPGHIVIASISKNNVTSCTIHWSGINKNIIILILTDQLWLR